MFSGAIPSANPLSRIRADFLLTQENNMTCFSSEQDCLNLATSLARLVKFVFACLEYSLQRIVELNSNRIVNSQLGQYEQAIEKCCKLLFIFASSPLLTSLLFVGLIEENQTKHLKTINFTDVYEQLEKLGRLTASQAHLVLFLQTFQNFNPNLQTKKYLQLESNLFNYRKSSNHSAELAPFNDRSDHLNRALISLNCVVSFDALLNPKTPSTKLAYQLYNIATSNHLKFHLICCELIRCSLISFADSLDPDGAKEGGSPFEARFLNQQLKASNGKPGKEDVRWASFIYFKMPLVLKSLKKLLKEKNQCLDLEKGLEKLIKYTPLIELIDYKTASDCLTTLLGKMVTLKLIDEKFKESLLEKREKKNYSFNSNDKNVLKKENENLMIKGHILVDRAEPTSNSMLKSLKGLKLAEKPENLMNMLINTISSTSIEIVLNALTYTDQLGIFIKYIIHFNEGNIASNNENSKQAALRGNLFDISFLVLFYVIQENGQEIILNLLEEDGIKFSDGVDLNSTGNRTCSDDMEVDEKPAEQQHELANSFFVKFCLDYLPEDLTKVNFEERFAQNVDANKVDYLLGQFSSDKFDYQNIKWDEVLLNSIGAFKELLNAYLANCLTFAELTDYLQKMIKRSCSIGLIIAFYAINHINRVSLEQKRKIILVLNYITNSNNFSSYFNDQAEVFNFYKEKFTLTLTLIRNLMKDLIPKSILENGGSNGGRESGAMKLAAGSEKEAGAQNVELYKVIKFAFSNTIKKGWLNTNSIYGFDKILCVGGATWFMDKLVKLLLYECETESLFEGVELIYGLSSLDMEQCALALLNVVVPQYLVNHNDQAILTEHKLMALSRLIASVTFSVLETDLRNGSGGNIELADQTVFKSTVRRNSSYYVEDSFINYEDRLNGVGALNGTASNGTLSNGKEDSSFSAPVHFLERRQLDQRKEFLFGSISRMLRLVSSLLNKQKISQRTNFSLILLEQLVYACPSNSAISPGRTFNPNLITNDITKIIAPALENQVQAVLQYLPFDAILNLVRIFPNKLNYDLLLSICNLQSSNSRKLACKALCQLSRSAKFN